MNNIPAVIVLILAMSIYARAGSIPLNDHSGLTSENGNGLWAAPEEARKQENPIPRDAGSIKRGRGLYLRNCASCHGESADGNGPAAVALNPGPANLKKMSGSHSDGNFAWKIENGREPMPAWKNILNKNQIWDLVNYIQSLSGSGKVQHNDGH